MKKNLLAVVVFFTFLNLGKAQTFSAESLNSNLEKSIYGVQVGLFGVDFYNERSLSDKFTFKSEFSLYGGFRSGAQYFLYPVFNIEPKYYYNIDKRAKEGKNIKNNGANYLSVSVSYIPDWFVISNYEVGNVKNRVRVIPTFGIRRNFGDNFNYEFNVGVGYAYTFDENVKGSDYAVDLGLKIGYDFK